MSEEDSIELQPNTPVIIGVGFRQEHLEDPAESSEPYQSMVTAVRRAAEDRALLERMTLEELCGCDVQVHSDGDFSLLG